MKRQLFASSLVTLSLLSLVSQPGHAMIVEREPNDERCQILGNLRLNQTFEVTGAFTNNDSLDHYKVDVPSNGFLRVRLKSTTRLFARVYHDKDRSGTVTQVDPLIGMIQVGQSLKTSTSGSYIIRVLKPAAISGIPTYYLSLQAEGLPLN